MAVMTIPERFYAVTQYTSASTASNNYVALDTVTSTYAPDALVLFNEVTLQTKTLSAGATTTGNVLDDRILSEMMAYFADMDFNSFHINPETGEPENRHQMAFVELLQMRYSVRYKDGTLYSPKQLAVRKASSYYVAKENTE